MLLHFFAVLASCCLLSSLALDLQGCGTTKSCIYSSSGCMPSSPSCLVFTYSYDSSQNIFNLELSGGSGDGNQYAAVAFSPTGEMLNSDLYYCSGNELRSGVIISRSSPSINASLPTGVTVGSAATNAGVAECTFQRPVSVTKTISGSSVQFNLQTSPFHAIMATGSITNGRIAYHRGNRYSSGPYQFTGPVLPAPTQAASTDGTALDNDRTALDNTGCGTSVGCFRNPDGCLPESSGCRFVSWTYNSDSNSFNFEIVGGGPGQYAAIAFGTEDAMADADLYYCTQNGLFSGAIFGQSPPQVSSSLESGISNVTSNVTNGALRCSFTRVSSITKTVSAGDVDFDLVTTSYYLLYAVGTSTNDALSYHRSNRVLSESKIDFKSVDPVGGSNSGTLTTDLIKAHACLMLIAWLTCASIGAIIARHFKPLWHGKTLCDTKVWFALHRGFMVFAVLCTVVAFILIFSAIQDFSSDAGAHPIIGIVVTFLALLNPLMALCRPHPGEPRRVIFNWAHWFVGSSARILALVAIFLGVDLTSLNLPEWDTWALVGFVVFHIVTEIALEVVSAVHGHISVYKKPSKSDDINLGGDDNNPPNEPPPTGAGIKYAILSVYVLVNLGFLLTFIVFIAIN